MTIFLPPAQCFRVLSNSPQLPLAVPVADAEAQPGKSPHLWSAAAAVHNQDSWHTFEVAATAEARTDTAGWLERTFGSV